MSWDGRLLRVNEPASLLERTGALFEQQMRAWPQLSDGVRGLSGARTREFMVKGFPIIARHIPHRIGSTTASVDADSIQQRACFLCPDNLPGQERVVSFGTGFMVAYNPYPILEGHMTIVRSQHTPQRIEGSVAVMLGLAEELKGFIVLYNGPECGASAPDHMHFQACRFDDMPLMADVEQVSGGVIPDYSRAVFVLQGRDPQVLEERFSTMLEILDSLEPGHPEPMINVVAFYRDKQWTLCVFPRSRHRPDVFYSGELTWSPGSIDLCGVIVLPVESDLARITAADIEAVFSEVSLESQTAAAIAARLGLA